VVTPLKLTRADLDKFPRQALRAKDHNGKEYNYEGVAIVDILQKAGLKFGDALRGRALASYLLVEAADGYQAVYALPEFDPPTKDRLILLADHQDAAVLPAPAGPLEIIAPGDKTHARWVRQVKSLTICGLPNLQALASEPIDLARLLVGLKSHRSQPASFRQVHRVCFGLEGPKSSVQIVWHGGRVIKRAGVQPDAIRAIGPSLFRGASQQVFA
jgi:hypothetical protein